MNNTGINPVGYKVLIRVDEVEDKSAGGIYLPDTTRDREEAANDKGLLVAVGEMAFADWKGKKPQVGDRVVFEKYAGCVVQHRGLERGSVTRYRLCNDTKIGAVIEEN